jgi:hypothetical protein
MKGKAFPCGRAKVSADPFCGETPQRPLYAVLRGEKTSRGARA